jgi:hypothetical protein
MPAFNRPKPPSNGFAEYLAISWREPAKHPAQAVAIVKSKSAGPARTLPSPHLVEKVEVVVCGRCTEEASASTTAAAERAAPWRGIPCLGAIPLEKAIREEADGGARVVVS